MAGISVWGPMLGPGLGMDPYCWDLNMCGSHLSCGCTAQGFHVQGPALSNSLDALRQVSSHLPPTSAPRDEVHDKVFASLVPCLHMHTHIQVYTHPTPVWYPHVGGCPATERQARQGGSRPAAGPLTKAGSWQPAE